MKTKVVFVIPNLGGGGAERVVVTLLNYIDRAKFDLILVVVDGQVSRYRKDLSPEVLFIDLNRRRVRNALYDIVRVIWRYHPDVVFSTLGHLNISIALLMPLMPGKTRFIAREATIASKGLARYRWPSLWRWAYRVFYKRFDAIVCQSHYMKEDLAANFGVPADKMKVIYNPLDISRITYAVTVSKISDQENLIKLVAAGRLVHEKGFDLLIEALALCDRKDVSLTILGEGPLESELRTLAHSRGVGGRVYFAGFQENPYLYFSRADAFVLSSRFEGFPNVALEALACGTSVIALPSAGGVREMLEGVSGAVIAEEVSVESLARAIDQWSVGPRVRPSPSVIAPYSASVIAEKYEKLLEPE